MQPLSYSQVKNCNEIISSIGVDPLIGHKWKDNCKCILKMILWFRVFAPGDELGMSGGKPSRWVGTGLQNVGGCVWHCVETRREVKTVLQGL